MPILHTVMYLPQTPHKVLHHLSIISILQAFSECTKPKMKVLTITINMLKKFNGHPLHVKVIKLNCILLDVGLHVLCKLLKHITMQGGSFHNVHCVLKKSTHIFKSINKSKDL